MVIKKMTEKDFLNAEKLRNERRMMEKEMLRLNMDRKKYNYLIKTLYRFEYKKNARLMLSFGVAGFLLGSIFYRMDLMLIGLLWLFVGGVMFSKH